MRWRGPIARSKRAAASIFCKEGVRRKDIAFLRSADFRYEGQEYQINCDMPGGKADKAAVRKAFDAAYLRQYGHANPERAMEIVTIRTMGIGRLDRPASPTLRAGKRPGGAQAKGSFRRQGDPRRRSWTASRLRRAKALKGPAIIEEPTATTILPPGWRASIAAGGHMLLTRG